MDSQSMVIKMMELDGRRNYLKGQVAGKAAAVDAISACLRWLESGKKDLGNAREELKKAGLDSLLVSDKLFPAFVSETFRMTQAAAEMEKEKADIIAESNKVQTEIDTLQAELKGQGIELNIGTKTPRVAVI